MKMTQSCIRTLGSVLLCLCLTAGIYSCVQAQNMNGTEQLINRGFEDWDNLNNDDIEPQGWNSFMTANTANSIIAAGKSRRLSREAGGRTGSKGQYYLRIFSSSVLGITANGNITTGRINMGSTSATNTSNHNFTDRGAQGFYIPQTTVPDSLIAWVKYLPKNTSPSNKAQISLLIHDDSRTQEPGTDFSHVVARAISNPSYTGQWERISIPFTKTNNTNNSQYLLASFTTNQTPGGGSSGDELLVDDILFVYNPTLALNKFTTSSIGLRDGAVSSLEIPFTVTGTMSPINNLADNVVIAEISDANGSFAKAIEIGKITTDLSGSLTAKIPPTLPIGERYRIRVRSTNYPLISNDNGRDIEVYKGYYIQALSNQNSRGNVSGTNTYKAGTDATLVASASAGNHFLYWTENEVKLEGVGPFYKFNVEKDRNLIAHFDTSTYHLALQSEGQGSVEASSTPPDGMYFHNEEITLTASPGEGCKFIGFYENGTLLSTLSPYSFSMIRDRDIVARFGANQYTLTVSSNNTALGSVSGSGSYKYQSHASLTATPKPYCSFLAWMIGNDTLSRETPYSHTVTETQRIMGVFTETFYHVSTLSQPSEGGKVSGGGRFSAQYTDTKVSLTATPEVGYLFDGWKQMVGKDTSYPSTNPLPLISGRITNDYTCVALFSPITYAIQTVAIPEGGGSLEGDGSYLYHQAVTLKAQAKEGYLFLGWVDATTRDTLSKNLLYTFIANKDLEIEASFALKTYRIEASVLPISFGNISGNGVYKHFEQVQLQAFPESGYEFRYWLRATNDTIEGQNPYTFYAKENVNLTAVFSILRKTVEVTVQPSQGGQIIGKGLYEHGGGANLQALANEGYKFEGWKNAEGDLLDLSSSIRFNVGNDTLLWAHFSPIPYTINISSSGNGEVSLDHANYVTSLSVSIPYDSVLQLYARPSSEGYKFTQWKQILAQGDTLLSTQSPFSFTVKGEARLGASFSNTTKEISAIIKPQTLCGVVKNLGNHESGYWAVLEAIASEGYRFARWENLSGDLIETDFNLGIAVKKDTCVVAVFEKAVLDIVTSPKPKEGGSSFFHLKDGEHTYPSASMPYGDTLIFEALPSLGYSFKHWQTPEGVVVSDENPYQYITTTSQNYQAVFDSLLFTVTTSNNTPSLGSVSGTGHYKYGTSATLQAYPTPGNHFLKWIGKKGENKQNPYTFIVCQDSLWEAVFDTITCSAQISNPTPEWGKLKLSSNNEEPPIGVPFSETYGSTITCQATPLEHYVFESFTDIKGRIVSQENPFIFNLKKDTLLNVSFLPEKYKVKAESFSQEKGTVNVIGGEMQFYGNTVKIKAEASSGYEFVRWVLADHPEQTFSPFALAEFELTQDTSLLALFEAKSFFVSCTANKDKAGTVSGEGVYTYGDPIVVSAVPQKGYLFNHWEVDQIPVSESETYTFYVEKASAVVAIFEPILYQLSIVSQPQTCGYTTGEGFYAYGDTATLKAYPNNDFFFSSWQNNSWTISEQNPFRIVITGDSLITALFRTDTLHIEARAQMGGSVSGGGDFVLRSTVQLKATLEKEYEFLGWFTPHGEQVSTENPWEFKAVENAIYQAYFSPKAYEVNLLSSGGGKLVGAGEYPYQRDIVLLAQSDSNHIFKAWKLTGESAEDSLLKTMFSPQTLSQARLTYTVLTHLSLEAEFSTLSYTLKAESSPAEAGTFTGVGTFNAGASSTLKAIPNAHYKFKAWTKNGNIVSLKDTLTVENINQDATYVGLFEEVYYTLSVGTYPQGGGVATGGGYYSFGDTVHVGIQLKYGFDLVDWTDAQFSTISTEKSFDFIVRGTEVLTATLEQTNVSNEETSPFAIKIYPNPAAKELHFNSAIPMRCITLYSASGKMEEQKNLHSTQAVLDIQQLPAGIHFYEVLTENGNTLRGKWIKY